MATISERMVVERMQGTGIHRTGVETGIHRIQFASPVFCKAQCYELISQGKFMNTRLTFKETKGGKHGA
jgi:hypothetical protein